MNANQTSLILNADNQKGSRKTHSLFIPKILRKYSKDQTLIGDKWDNAHKIIKRWADIEASGKLYKRKEVALRSEFLTEIFGTALGYTLFSENKNNWNLDFEYQVNGGAADAALGLFEENNKITPNAIIELKSPKVNLDRDRSSGRTPVQQCWDYLNALPECQWGILSNFSTIRIYHRNRTPRFYQQFNLIDLLNENVFYQFYYLLEKGGIIPTSTTQKSRAEKILDYTQDRYKEVGEELYQHYDENRYNLIHYLKSPPENKSLETSIRIAQKLIDRIIFVAFCQSRDLLPEDSIKKAYENIPPFAQVTNPRWQNFLQLFISIDKGNKRSGIAPYNGGLFKKDNEVDNLNLDDSWTGFFNNIGKYDFRDEVNVDVLGHLFEKSVGDIGRIRMGGLFGEELNSDAKPKMAKSAERKRFGIYYTPPEFTDFITRKTIKDLIDDRFLLVQKKQKITKDDFESSEPSKKMSKYWQSCLSCLLEIKIVDPACGSGAFLISTYDLLEELYHDIIDHMEFHDKSFDASLYDQISQYILNNNIYGVDLSPEAIEITQLALWIRSAIKGQTLADLSKNIRCGNSLLSDISVHPRAMEWETTFPEVFKRNEKGFDCVIGNPPWERMKLQEREFFDASAPDIANSVNAADRRKKIEKLKKDNPELFEKYLDAKETAEKTLDHVRKSSNYPLTGTGDINTYAIFSELALNIVSPNGRVGLLVPSGISTDNTTKAFFERISTNDLLFGLYDFENKKGLFPDVHRAFKFSVLLFGGTNRKFKSSEFFFFAHSMSDLNDKKRQISLTSEDIKLLNPNTKTCPVFRSKRDAEITKSVYRRVPIFIDKNRKSDGNAWGIKFFTMFHQTNDAEHFKTADYLKKLKYKLQGNIWVKGKKKYLPLYEAKMIQMYDHRAASVVIKEENWFRQGQPVATTLVSHQNQEFVTIPRWWADNNVINKVANNDNVTSFIAFKNVTSPTNTRTMISTLIPFSGVINSAPLIIPDKKISDRMQCCLLSNINSFALDYITRQKIGNVNLNFFIIEQLPIFPPETYSQKCPWDKKHTLEEWISERVLKLTCTSNDMIPLAEACNFKEKVHKWDTEDRAELMAQLDAAYFHLYEISIDDVKYILSTFSGTDKESGSLFGGENITDKILRYYKQFKKDSKN